MNQKLLLEVMSGFIFGVLYSSTSTTVLLPVLYTTTSTVVATTTTTTSYTTTVLSTVAGSYCTRYREIFPFFKRPMPDAYFEVLQYF